jgi:hypothetical protein
VTARRHLVVWVVLVVATLVSWRLGPAHGLEGVAHAGTAVAIAIAFGKAWLVGEEFMELRRAPVVLRAAFGVWVLAAGVTLTLLYLLA